MLALLIYWNFAQNQTKKNAGKHTIAGSFFKNKKKDSTYSWHFVKQYLEDLEEEKTLLFAKKKLNKNYGLAFARCKWAVGLLLTYSARMPD